MASHADVLAWVRAYESAWRSPGTSALADVFTADATYLPSPWREPIVGLDALGPWWEAAREGPDESFTLHAEVVAVDGDVGIVRVEVTYAPPRRPWRDLWIVRLTADGRCSSFEEWPFAPDQDDGH